jgi:hypothetical protein
MQPARASGGGGAGVVVGVLVALLLVGGVGSGVGYYLYARSRGSQTSDDDDKPSKTKDKEKPIASKHASDDDDDDGDGDVPSAKTIRKRMEADGWTVAGDSTTHSTGMQMLVLTASRGTESGAIYLYVYDDPKMAETVESSLTKSPGMSVRRKGGVIYMAYSSLNKGSSKALLDAVFPP